MILPGSSYLCCFLYVPKVFLDGYLIHAKTCCNGSACVLSGLYKSEHKRAVTHVEHGLAAS